MSDPKLVAEWMQKAEGDFQTATRMMRWRKKPQLDSVCYHCQQCAEKYVKAFLLQHDVAFPWIHNLPKLNELCMKVDGSFGLISDLLETLNPFEAETRYPGYFADKDDARLAIAAMKEVRKFVREKLGLK